MILVLFLSVINALIINTLISLITLILTHFSFHLFRTIRCQHVLKSVNRGKREWNKEENEIVKSIRRRIQNKCLVCAVLYSLLNF